MMRIVPIIFALAFVTTCAHKGRASSAEVAVQTTATTASECTALGDFYWEIGDSSGSLTSGSIGSSYTGSTQIPIASASKLVFGAYLMEKRAGSLTAADQKALTMATGYSNFVDCGSTTTVGTCYAYSTNSTYTAGNDGKFYYGGGHFQYETSVTLGLSAATNAALTAEYQNYLGSDLGMSFVTPQPAGGLYTSATNYAAFLRKIMNGSFRIKGQLGQNAVCTLPSSCSSSVYSPSPEAWHYDYGHWVEDDPATGDGAFSSPGKFGFYPWISADKSLYGILSRYDTVNTLAFYNSVQCGRKLRKAWVTGKSQ